MIAFLPYILLAGTVVVLALLLARPVPAFGRRLEDQLLGALESAGREKEEDSARWAKAALEEAEWDRRMGISGIGEEPSGLRAVVAQIAPEPRQIAAERAVTSIPEAAKIHKADLGYVLKPGFSAMPPWKRCLDIGLLLATAVLWFPLMVFITVWIKCGSRGPVIFRQSRVGRDGRVFTMWKFRSMKCGVETMSHELNFKALVENGVPMTKLGALDRRLIPGGRFLRRTGLDELPQLWHVLSGKMSLVGPRPCVPGEMECYTQAQRARFYAVPGLTGYWQVSGKNRTTFNQMVEMDIEYVARMSFLFDVAILLQTVPALITQWIESRWTEAGSRMCPGTETIGIHQGLRDTGPRRSASIQSPPMPTAKEEEEKILARRGFR